MTDTELAALTAIVNRETVRCQSDVQKYGEVQFDPQTPAVWSLKDELTRRGISC